MDINCLKFLMVYDKDGYILLYCVVVGGFKDIFKVLKEVICKIKIDDMIYGGYIVLYIVCKYKKLCMCVYLLFDENNVNFFLNKKLN